MCRKWRRRREKEGERDGVERGERGKRNSEPRERINIVYLQQQRERERERESDKLQRFALRHSSLNCVLKHPGASAGEREREGGRERKEKK